MWLYKHDCDTAEWNWSPGERESTPRRIQNIAVTYIGKIETNTFEFRDPQLERLVALTAADRKWMDDIVKDVNDGWNDADPNRSSTMQ